MDIAKFKVWVNEDLGETFEERTEVPDWEALYKRREHYQIGSVPRGACVLTAGIDVQRDRIETEIVGWGVGFESWNVDTVVIPGDPNGKEIWDELEQLLGRSWRHACGLELRLTASAIDAGDGVSTMNVYAFARRMLNRAVYAIAGRDLHNLMLGHPKPVDIRDKAGKRIKYRGVKLWTVGVDVIKRELYGFLRHPTPLNDGEPFAPGFCHFPERDREYFKQLCAEQLVMHKNKKGYLVAQWEKTRDRNEALDCRVYARAAAEIAGLGRWTPERWAIERAKVDSEAPAPARAAPPRKTRKSNYWG